MAGWTSKKNLIYEELTQRREEGCDITGFRERLDQCGDDDARLTAVYNELAALDVCTDFPYKEPNTLEEIDALRDGSVFTPSENITYDKFVGAWTGRCCGCALGKPLETGYSMGGSGGRKGYENVKLWFEERGEWPITDYTPEHSPAEAKYDIHVGCPASTREHISFMESDDDIRYTVLGLLAAERWGESLTPFNIGELWLSELPYYYVCTAERQAYLNYVDSSDISDPSERLKYTREYLNPYREWIGAQIRVDAYGYAAAGDPWKAAKMAFADASFSHVKNGIYGAMFCAATISAAFAEADKTGVGLTRCIEAGLSVIPKTSRLYSDIKLAIKLAREHKNDLDALIAAIYDAFGSYHPVHTNNNAALCAAALIYSDGDFEKAITAAVSGGWDTDCNGATTGSVIGALLGADAIPDKWKAPLHNTIYSCINEFHPTQITACAERSMKTWEKLRG